jgi:uncharacterized protein (TIGR02147 family)
METTRRPNIFDYLDFRKFLADYFESRQRESPGFSKGDFSREVFCPGKKDGKKLKHRGYFNDIVNKGTVVTANTAELFIQAFKRDKELKFDKDEAQYFRALIAFNQATIPDEREMHFHHLISLNHSPRRILNAEMLSLYNEWHHSVIRAILDVYNFKDDYAALAKNVSPPITPKQAKDSIKLLSSLGLIRKNDKGFWKPTDKSISAPPQAQNELIIQYQLALMEFAKQSLLTNHSRPQNIATNTISLSEEAFKTLRERLEKFRSEARAIVAKDDKPATKVYQLNIQLFPASKEKAV